MSARSLTRRPQKFRWRRVPSMIATYRNCLATPARRANLPNAWKWRGATPSSKKVRAAALSRLMSAATRRRHVQWLLSPRDNGFIEKLGGFPPLAEGEALLENAYTPPAFRGLGVMAAAMAQIAERASDFGGRKVLTFVATDNVASLKGCQRARASIRIFCTAHPARLRSAYARPLRDAAGRRSAAHREILSPPASQRQLESGFCGIPPARNADCATLYLAQENACGFEGLRVAAYARHHSHRLSR